MPGPRNAKVSRRSLSARYRLKAKSLLKGLRDTITPRDSAATLTRDQQTVEWLRSEVGLKDREIARIEMLAQVRGESLKKTFRKTLANLLGMVPAKITERNLIRQLDFKAVEMENGLTKVTLANGRVFYGFPSRQKYANVYFALRDLHPRGFTAETYAAGVDAAIRYQRGAEYNYLPGEGGVIIEGGAYVGYKAVRLAEVVGPSGRVIAIEIGRRNYEVLCQNIAVNGMEHIIAPVHCGIWKEKGEMEAEFEHANWYHLAKPDSREFVQRKEMVPVDTLDNIIDAHNLQTVDFLNLQLNGAEFEGLQGLQRRFDDVKILRVAAYYTRDGVKQVDVITDMLVKRGCKILALGKIDNIIAVTPRFANEFKVRPSAAEIS